MDKEPITIIGLKNLKSELEDLKNIQRPKVVEAIAEVRLHHGVPWRGRASFFPVFALIPYFIFSWCDKK